MNLNPSKGVFVVTSGKFLGYLVMKRGIEASPEQVQAINNLKSPTNVKEVLKLTGRIAALNRFISKSSEKCKDFYGILRKNKKFEWTEKHELALQSVKNYLSSAPSLMKPLEREPLILYLAVSSNAISAVLVKDHEGNQHPVYYVSKSLIDAESRNAIKSQALADFVADFSSELEEQVSQEIQQLEETKDPWIPFKDGASNVKGTGLGILLKSPQGDIIPHSIACEFQATNNEAEYEALIAVKGEKLIKYFEMVRDLAGSFEAFDILQDHALDALRNRKLKKSLKTFMKEILEIILGAGKLPKAPGGKVFMLAMTDYFSNWIEAEAFPQFIGSRITNFCNSWGIKMITSTPVHPKANGQAESSNKIIINNLKKKLGSKKGKWAKELPYVLWADRTTPKNSTRPTLFSILFGNEAVIPTEMVFPTAKTSICDPEANA
ncbi:uncharacterized protein LOC143529107 [Bidens hawaiensis]|uniref:uncharacterized protein LOC143529107 n=1 Tax=Bidens hawaiensis TaxID=980011 RepID=UPI0040493241